MLYLLRKFRITEEICLGFIWIENVLFALALHLDLAIEVSDTIQKYKDKIIN